VLPAGRGGRVAVDEAGAFTADIDLAGLEGRAVAWLRAEDRFGHLTLMAVRSGAPPAAAEIEITSPAGIGWYRSSLSVEGRVVGSSTPVESLAWSVSGDEGLSGEILVDSDGAFTLELETADLAGDRLLSLAGGDADSSVSAVEIELRDGRLEPGVRIDSPSNGGSYGSRLRLAGAVIDPYAGVPGMGGFESVSWEMAPFGTSSREGLRSGAIDLGEDGTFDLTVPAREATGEQLVMVVAVGKSGNRGESGARVTRGEGDIPSFSAAAATGS
jgi:hypothetical protein